MEPHHWKHLATRLVALVLLTACPTAPPPVSEMPAQSRGLPRGAMGFEVNRGQAPEGSAFVARARGYLLEIGSTEFSVVTSRAAKARRRPSRSATPVLSEATLSALGSEAPRLSFERLRVALVGGNPRAEVRGRGLSGALAHYFLGAEAQRWLRDIPIYRGVLTRSVLPGIDMRWRGRGDVAHVEFVVQAGGDPGRIRFRLDGHTALRLDPAGHLEAALKAGVVRFSRPRVHQIRGGRARPVDARYELLGSDTFGLWVGAHDASEPLFIDPEIRYSAALGTAEDEGDARVAAGPNDTLLFATRTPGLLLEPTGDPAPHGGYDVMVARYDASLPEAPVLQDVAYLGGSDDELDLDLAVDAAGEVYVVGTTRSDDLWTSPLPLRDAPEDDWYSTGFAVHLAADLEPLHSTYLWPTVYSVALTFPFPAREGVHVAVEGATADPGFGVLVAGTTSEPGLATTGAFDEAAAEQEGFVARLPADLSALEWFTYLGGDYVDAVGDVAVRGGRAYVVGQTASEDFPIQGGLAHPGGEPGIACEEDFFVCFRGFASVVAADGASLAYSTRLPWDESTKALGVRVDPVGRAHVVGGRDFWEPRDNGSSYNRIGSDAFALRLSAAGSTAEVEQLWFDPSDFNRHGTLAHDLEIGMDGRWFITGTTRSFDRATSFAPQAQLSGGNDAYLMTRAADGALEFFTYLGGSRAETGWSIARTASGLIAVAGTSDSDDFPLKNSTLAAQIDSDDAFLTLFTEGGELRVDKRASPDLLRVGESVEFCIDLSYAGAGAAQDLSVVDVLPADWELDASDLPPACDYDAETRVLRCGGLGPIPDGQVSSLCFDATVVAAGASCNTASVSSTNGFVAVSEPRCITSVTELPNLTLEKRVSPGSGVREGDVVTYDIIVRNTGDVPAEGVEVSDLLNGRTRLLEFAGQGCQAVYDDRIVTCTYDAPPGNSGPTLTVVLDDGSGGRVCNRAELLWGDESQLVEACFDSVAPPPSQCDPRCEEPEICAISCGVVDEGFFGDVYLLCQTVPSCQAPGGLVFPVD